MQPPCPSDEELIDLIYAALLGESSWQRFLDRLTASLPGGRATLFFHDASRKKGAFSLVSSLDAKTVEAYDNHFSRINPWMPKASIRPIGRGVVAEEMLPRAEFLDTEFYNDFMKSIDCESAAGVTIMREDGCSFLLSILTARDDPDANRAAADQLSRIAPHLRRAFHFYRKQDRINMANEAVAPVFEALGIGILIIGANARLKSASPMALRIMEEDVGLRISSSGRVTARCPRISGLIESMTQVEAQQPSIANAVLPGSDPARTVKTTLVRCAGDPYSTYFEGPSVIVLLEPLHGAESTAAAESLASFYRLTMAERRVLEGLVTGQTVREIAAASGTSWETVRSHLKGIYSKVGVSRQVDLVRLAGKFGTHVGVAPRA